MQKALTLFILLITSSSHAQSLKAFADSIRTLYRVPALCYAVVSADSIIDIQYLGLKMTNRNLAVGPSDRFRIGSNTKAITAAIATQMVSERHIMWDTKLLDLCPEFRSVCDTTFRHITLLDLLDMKVPFPKYTYTDKTPSRKQLNPTGKLGFSEEGLAFMRWFLSRPPEKTIRIHRCQTSATSVQASCSSAHQAAHMRISSVLMVQSWASLLTSVHLMSETLTSPGDIL